MTKKIYNYMALCTGLTINNDVVCIQEPNDPNYSRIKVSGFSVFEEDGEVFAINRKKLTFPKTTTSFTITHLAITEEKCGGEVLLYLEISKSGKVINPNHRPTIHPNGLKVGLESCSFSYEDL